jgi:hypothetical protein
MITIRTTPPGEIMKTADKWDIFYALTCDHPMLADIKDWMLPPFPAWMPDWQKQGRDKPEEREE